ncbi:DNA alkylation repair protein [Streptomyces sp. NPDC001205]
MSLSHARLAEAADQLTEQLARLGTPRRAAWDRDYLRSDLVHLGVAIPDLRRAVNATRRRLPPPTRADALALADLLWTSSVYEHRQAAATGLVRGRHGGRDGVLHSKSHRLGAARDQPP